MNYQDWKNSATQFGAEIYQSLLNIINHKIGLIQTAVSQEQNGTWTALVTDVITIAAALGALALPISLNVIETTRTRYKSPSLLKITSSLSGVNTRRLNLYLFITLGISLLVKIALSTQIFEIKHIALSVCGLTIIFIILIRMVYIHLKFTYTFMSNIEAIHEKILSNISMHADHSFLKKHVGWRKTISALINYKSLSFTQSNIKDSIAALMELESYLLSIDPLKTDLNDRIKGISYIALHALDDHEANRFTRHILAALPSVLATAETSREVDVYQSVASFYLHLAMGAILAKEEYIYQIGVIERIARFREEKLPAYGRFCRTGRLFLSFASKSESANEVYSHLLNHFILLIETSAREQPENIPELLNSVRQVIQFKGNYENDVWELPRDTVELWEYPGLLGLDRDIAEAYMGRLNFEELNEKIETRYKPEILEFIKNKSSEPTAIQEKIKRIDENLMSCRRGVALNIFSNQIETETLRVLAGLLSKHPEIFIQCRELRNPAGSSAYNVGHSPVPTSLGECIKAFVAGQTFSSQRSVRHELQEYKIVDAIGALIIYELWNIFILNTNNKTIKAKIETPSIPDCQLGELKAARTRISLLETSLIKALENTKFTDCLGLLAEQKTVLRKYACEFSEKLSIALKNHTMHKIANQKLDSASLDRFKREVTASIESSIKNLDLFKRITLSNVTPIVSTIKISREAFLSGNGTHYIFDNYGREIAHEVHNWLNAQILFHSNQAENSDITLPTKKADWLICSSNALKKFRSVGFTTSGRKIFWPDGKSSIKFVEIHCESQAYYLVLPKEILITATYPNEKEKLPIRISHNDNGEHVDFKFEYYVSPIQPYPEA